MEFNSSRLGSHYTAFCKLANASLKEGIMDLSNIRWFYPSMLLPLSIFCREHPQIEVIPPRNPGVSMYWSIMTKEPQYISTNLPIVGIPTDHNKRNEVLDYLNFVEDGKVIGGTGIFMFFISETVDNIYQHSKFSNAWAMAQRYPRMGFMDISIVDDGISIPQSFQNAGYRFEDWEAIYNATMGMSTKKEQPGRGWGLTSSLKLLTDGLNGECLIVSRNGALIAGVSRGAIYDKNRYPFIMQDELELRGTFISMRIPYQSQDVDIFKYIE